ncbi:hypothetical protein Pmani_014242 [Petrolisthes manimaculis]|uniref:Stathmin n=1 Tax=Petrolisthes manimaculis TaxID=1843537 RepID=A0AAE1U8Y6_9EUCA|nr:hypothetical protein Pmani_014242 [Petrolisthes manimaculis]
MCVIPVVGVVCRQCSVEMVAPVGTEIRCEKKSRGGISYEVILAEPSADKPLLPTSVSPKSMTAEEITQKLQQAEERRKLMEESRLATLEERISRLEEASRKREETNAAYIYATQAALEDKLNATSINREAYQNGLRAKIMDRLNNVDNVRKQLDAKTNDLRQTIEDKLRCAEENRTESIRKMCEKLKEHLEKRIKSKIVLASANRNTELMKKLENFRKQRHVLISVTYYFYAYHVTIHQTPCVQCFHTESSVTLLPDNDFVRIP